MISRNIFQLIQNFSPFHTTTVQCSNSRKSPSLRKFQHFFRQINSLVTYLVKPRENSRNFHTALCTLGGVKKRKILYHLKNISSAFYSTKFCFKTIQEFSILHTAVRKLQNFTLKNAVLPTFSLQDHIPKNIFDDFFFQNDYDCENARNFVENSREKFFIFP